MYVMLRVAKPKARNRQGPAGSSSGFPAGSSSRRERDDDIEGYSSAGYPACLRDDEGLQQASDFAGTSLSGLSEGARG